MSNQTILTNPSTVSQLQRGNESSLDRRRSELRQALSDGVIVDVKPGGDQMTTSQSASNRPSIISPNAVLAASEEDAAAQRRREIRDTLVNGGSIAVNPQGEISKEGSQNPSQPAIIAPKGILAGTQTSGDDAAAQRRREISDMLVRGGSIAVNPQGEISREDSQNPSQPAIIAPDGVLASAQTNGDDAAAQRRREIRDTLVNGGSIAVNPQGEISKEGSQDRSQPAIIAPKGILAGTQTNGDDDAAHTRKEIRDTLVIGDSIAATTLGEINGDDEAVQRRREIRSTLLRSGSIAVSDQGAITLPQDEDTGDGSKSLPGGNVDEEGQAPLDSPSVYSVSQVDDQARQDLINALLEDIAVHFTAEGDYNLVEDDTFVSSAPDSTSILSPSLKPSDNSPAADSSAPVKAIDIPSGMLGASFYWYERDHQLYLGEVSAMQRFFPSFRLEKLSDGRLYWWGAFYPRTVNPNARWVLQAVYNHNHPDKSCYGGSIRIYTIQPVLEELRQQIGESIPHVLTDDSGKNYLCTNRTEDMKTGTVSTSAASALSWAAKWIHCYELWQAGYMTKEQFARH